MNDERLGQAAGMWLRDIDSAPTDPRASVRQAMGQVRETRQVRGWWPFPQFRRKALTPVTTDTAAYETAPIPATNGQAPTVIGRTQTMFSPVKAITAGVIVFGIGGVVLLARPYGDQTGIAPGAATDESRSAPVEVTGTITCGPSIRPATSEQTVVPLADGDMIVTSKRGDAWRQTATMSDPRLDGSYYISENTDEYRVPGSPTSVTVTSGTRRIENDEGAWQGTDRYAYLSDGMITALSTVLVGEGAYEGLSVIWEELSPDDLCDVNVRGIIIDGDVPIDAEPFVGQ